MKEFKITQDIIDNFIDKLLIMDSECWEWQGGYSSNGYGSLYLGTIDCKYVQALVHQLSYRIFKGEIGDFHVLHKCDNKRCCNPLHLFLGTHLDNIQDRQNKGRTLRGWNQPMATLLDSEVDSIRQLYSTGEYSQRKLAKKFNVHQATVSKIVNFKRRVMEQPMPLPD